MIRRLLCSAVPTQDRHRISESDAPQDFSRPAARGSMHYLLVNHVPLGRGSADGRYLIGDLFLQDLRAQARAIEQVRGRLVVATPCLEEFAAADGGSFNTVEVKPQEQGFEYVALPRYLSMRQFLSVRSQLTARLAAAAKDASIVQMDTGGYPAMLGQVTWPVVSRLNKRRIWVFDGADPFPRLLLHAAEQSNPLRRLAMRAYIGRMISFCRKAIREAELVFSHNAAIVQRFSEVWNEHCHLFNRSFVTDDVLIDEQTLDQRQRQLLDPRAPLRLVAAGRQIKIKGTDHVLRALAAARRQGVDVTLDVMGDGPDLPLFKRLAGELGVADRVRFVGTVPYGQPLFDAWAQAHVMVVTNLTAEISRNVLLSCARGLPLITYSNLGTDALLRGHDAGVIVPTGDTQALCTAIMEAEHNRQRLASLAANGLQLARCCTLDATHRRRAELASESLLVAPHQPSALHRAARMLYGDARRGDSGHAWPDLQRPEPANHHDHAAPEQRPHPGAAQSADERRWRLARAARP